MFFSPFFKTLNCYDSFNLITEGYSLYADICLHYGSSLGMLGDFESGVEFLEKGLKIAQKSGDKLLLAEAGGQYGSFFLFKGEGESAIKHLKKSLAIFQELKLAYGVGVFESQLAYAYYYQGDLETAQKHGENGLKIFKDNRFKALLSNSYGCLCMIYLDNGKPEEALYHAEKSLELAIKNNEEFIEGNTTIFLGRILHQQDTSRFNQAERYILQGMTKMEELKSRPYLAIGYMFLGDLYVDMKQKNKALENIKIAKNMFMEMGIDYWLQRTQKVLDRL